MSEIRKNGIWVLAAAILLASGVLYLGMTQSATGQAAAIVGGGGPRYTIVETDITNLLVVDNQRNTVYFYTVDQGQEPGADLKLRGSLDLTQVGKPVIKPERARPQE
jgi:hypothetical protein